MQKDKKVLIFLVVILVIIGGIMLFVTFNKEEIPVEKSDSIKIKEEYAALNNQTNESNNRLYPLVELKDNNPFVISNENEVIDILKEKSGVIYFGYASCSWCRSLMPILENVLMSNNIKKAYYLNIQNIRDVLDLDDSGNVLKKEDGSSGYYKILELLDEQLDTYYLEKDGKEVDTGEKRLYSPTIVVVENGKVVGIHVGTIDTQKSGYDKLTDDEIKELTKKLEKVIEPIIPSTCSEEAC